MQIRKWRHAIFSEFHYYGKALLIHQYKINLVENGDFFVVSNSDFIFKSTDLLFQN